MILTVEQIMDDIHALPEKYKTGDVDRLIRKYVREKADVSLLRPHILEKQKLHRIYYFVSLKQLKSVDERMDFIHNNLFYHKTHIFTTIIHKHKLKLQIVLIIFTFFAVIIIIKS